MLQLQLLVMVLLDGESGRGGRLAVVVLLAVMVIHSARARATAVVVERKRRWENAHRMVRVRPCLARTGARLIKLIVKRADHGRAAVLVVWRLQVVLVLLLLLLVQVRLQRLLQAVHHVDVNGRRRSGHLRRRRWGTSTTRLCHDGLLLGHELGQMKRIERRHS